jgi:hypothetical protein
VERPQPVSTMPKSKRFQANSILRSAHLHINTHHVDSDGGDVYFIAQTLLSRAGAQRLDIHAIYFRNSSQTFPSKSVASAIGEIAT